MYEISFQTEIIRKSAKGSYISIQDKIPIVSDTRPCFRLQDDHELKFHIQFLITLGKLEMERITLAIRKVGLPFISSNLRINGT